MDCLKKIRGVGSKVVKDVHGQEWTLSDIVEFEMTETGDRRGELIFNNSDNEQKRVVVLMSGNLPEEEFHRVPSLIDWNMGNLLDKTNPVRIGKRHHSIYLEVPPGPLIQSYS